MPYKDKNKRKEYARQWARDNPEVNKAWVKRNPKKSKEIKKRWDIKNPNNHRKRQLKYRKTHTKKIRELDRNYKIRNPVKVKARKIANYYINIKGVMCSKCKERQAEHRHHSNYNHPLDVELLCYQCHRNTHKMKGGIIKK